MEDDVMPWDEEETPTEFNLLTELQFRRKRLDDNTRERRVAGMTLAEKEYAYQTTRALKVLELRAENIPGNIISQIIYGTEPVATKRFERDAAKVTFDCIEDAINTDKLQIKIIEGQLNREYSNPQASF